MLKLDGKTKDITVQRFYRTFLGVFATTLLLAGCAITPKPTTAPSLSSPTPPSAASWEKRKASLARIQNWQVNGKIAVQTANDAGTANVDWAQHEGNYVISLYGPLGAQGFKLTGQNGLVTLQTNDGKQYTAPSPEQLLAERWRFNLPVSNLKYWIRGLPAPGLNAKTVFDSENRLTSLTQQGWQIVYDSYTTAGAYDLPQRLTITGNSLKIKVAISRWNA